MNFLADWYPGDGAAFVALETLAMITAIVALAWAAERLVARRHAALRGALWLAALAGVLLAPGFVLMGRQLPWRVAVLAPAGATSARTAESSPVAAEPGPGFRADLPPGEGVKEPARQSETAKPSQAVPPGNASEAAPSSDAVPNPAPAPTPQRDPAEAPAATSEAPAPARNLWPCFAALGFFIWGLGSVCLGVRLLVGWRRLGRLRCRLRPLDDTPWAGELREVARQMSVRRLPELCLSAEVRGPLVLGLFPPRVVLPEGLPERTKPEQLRAILVHECAHVVRRDPWVRLLQRLAAALFWVHPLVHLLNRRLDRAREEVCDNHVLAHTDAPAYAETLLTVAQICYPVPRLEGNLTMLPCHYNLERRVADLLEDRRDTATRLPTPQRAGLLAALVLLLAAFSSVGLHGAAPAQGEKAKAGPPAKEKAPAAEKLTGQVIHAADGKAAAGAIVWAAQFHYGPLERKETVADAEGRYALDLGPGAWWVWARRGSQGGEGQPRSDRIEIAAGKAPKPVTIRIEERGTFRGRLLEAETGKPIAGGQLVLDAGLALVTDAEGRFEVGGLSREGHESFVVAPGRMRLRVLFDTTARADTELEVRVPRAGKIVGRVTDLDGKPVPGAYVGRYTSGSSFSINALFLACDAEGRFAYDDAVPPGQPTWLAAAAPGYDEDERRLVVPADGKPLEVHFRIRPKPGTPGKKPAPDEEKRRTVSGVVRGPDARPVAGVLVRWGYQPFVGAIETRTDDKGRFRLTVPDKADMLAVLPRDLTPAFPDVAAGGDQTVEVVLQAGQSARGRVRDDAGKPIPGVRVVAVVPSPEPRIGNPYWLTEASVRTDAQGRYHLKGVPDNARLDFTKEGLTIVRNRDVDFTAANNDVVMLYGGAVKGRVLDRDGKPIRNFRVLVGFPRERQAGDKTEGFFAGYSGMGVRFTSPDGTFVLTGVAAGSVYRITALAEGQGEAVLDRVVAVPVNRLAQTEAATLRARPPAALRVKAETDAGKPVVGALVTLVNGQPGLDDMFSWGYNDASWEDMARGLTGADGRADFPALGFGEATWLVQAPGYGRRRAGWRNGEHELTVKLKPEAVVAGEVRDPAGKPVKECYVRLKSGGDQISASVGPDDKGRFRVGELPTGPWTLTVTGADGLTVLHEEQFDLQAGETKRLKIVTAK